MAISIVPRSFLFVIPLQVGAEIIAACAILNKVSALYGLGALFTGHGLTPMQWIMNLVSAAMLPLVIWGYSSIQHRRSLRVLAFAHFYILDTLVSLGFTIYFIVYWFAIAGKASNNPPSRTGVVTGTSNSYRNLNARASSDSGDAAGLDKSVAVGQELALTIVATTIFLVIRFYFMMCILGYARLLTRRTNLRSSNGQPPDSRSAKLQFILIRPFEMFWTGQKARRNRASSFGPAETHRLEPERQF